MVKNLVRLSFLSTMLAFTVLIGVSDSYTSEYNEKSAFKSSSYFFKDLNSNDMRDTVNRIKQRQSNEKSSITFQFITDSHYSNNIYGKRAINHFEDVRKLSKLVDSDFIVHGGDIIDGNYRKEKTLKTLKKATGEMLRSFNCPVYLVRGNHDDNYCYNTHHTPGTWENIISPEAMYECFIKPNEEKIIRDSTANSLYYYIDIPSKKLRVVVLDTNDYIYRFGDDLGYKSQYELSALQLKWAAEKAFNLSCYNDSESWGILLFSHIGLSRKVNDNQNVVNGDKLLKILKAVKKGEDVSFQEDFKGKKIDINGKFKVQKAVDFLCIISGDCHEDHTLSEEGIHHIVTLNSIPVKFESNITPIRVLNSSSENAFDTFVIDRDSREINIIRFGAGADRKIKY